MEEVAAEPAEDALVYEIGADGTAAGVAPEDVKLVSGFGGGLGSGENCGALLGALAALSKALVRERAHATTGFGATCAGLVNRFRAELGTIECTELKEKYRRPDVRCLYVVERAAAILDEYMQELEEKP